MAAGIGFLLGAGLGLVGNHGRQKAQEKAQNDLAFHEFQSKNAESMTPEMWAAPQGQKMAKDIWGEHAETGIMLSNARHVMNQQFQTKLGQAGGSTGAAPPGGAGGTPAGSPGLMMPQAGAPGPSFGPSQQAQSQQAQPQQGPLDGHHQHLAMLNKQLADYTALEGQFKEPEQLAQIKSAKEDTKSQIAQTESDIRQFDSEHRQDVAQAGMAARQDKSEAAMSDRQTKSEAALGDRQTKTEAASNERQDKSIAALGDRLDKSIAAHTAKVADTDKPWTAKDGAGLRSSVSASVNREFTPQSVVGKLFSGPEVEEKEQEMSRRMLDLGVLPSGQRMSDVGAVAGRDKTTGKIVGYKEHGQWYPL